MPRVSRRTFVLATAALAPAAAGAAAAGMFPARSSSEALPTARPYRYFDPAEARFIETACERLVPADLNGVGAGEAGVPLHLDAFLAEDTTRTATWFRFALAATLRNVATIADGSGPFATWDAADQTAYLRALESGTLELDGVSPRDFFRTLLALSVDAYLQHPVHGPARDRFAWPVDGLGGVWTS